MFHETLQGIIHNINCFRKFQNRHKSPTAKTKTEVEQEYLKRLSNIINNRKRKLEEICSNNGESCKISKVSVVGNQKDSVKESSQNWHSNEKLFESFEIFYGSIEKHFEEFISEIILQENLRNRGPFQIMGKFLVTNCPRTDRQLFQTVHELSKINRQLIDSFDEDMRTYFRKISLIRKLKDDMLILATKHQCAFVERAERLLHQSDDNVFVKSLLLAIQSNEQDDHWTAVPNTDSLKEVVKDTFHDILKILDEEFKKIGGPSNTIKEETFPNDRFNNLQLSSYAEHILKNQYNTTYENPNFKKCEQKQIKKDIENNEDMHLLEKKHEIAVSPAKKEVAREDGEITSEDDGKFYFLS